MIAEAREAPQTVADQLAHNTDEYRAFGALLRQQIERSQGCEHQCTRSRDLGLVSPGVDGFDL